MATKKKALAVKKPAAKTAPTSGSKIIKTAKKTLPLKKVAPAKTNINKIAKPAVKNVKPLTKVVVKKAVPLKKAATSKVALTKKPSKPTEKPLKPVLKSIKTPAKAQKVIAKNIIKKVVIKKKTAIKAIQPPPKYMAKKEVIKPAATTPVPEKTTAKPAAEVKAKEVKVPAPKPIVMPKIITKTVRKYQPDFTKSVLDKAERDPGAPTQRYSDPELLEFKELIQRKLEAAKKELSYLHGLITRKDELGGDEGDNRYMTMEDGSLSMEREQLSQMASRQITFIDHLEKAIMRIENKTYGICRVTGKLIDKARLRAVPHATLSIEAKMGSVK